MLSLKYVLKLLFTSPCSMCTGAILLYRIPRVVVGENTSFLGSEDLLRSHGVEVIVVDNEECKELMKRFMQEKPEVSSVVSSLQILADGLVGMERRYWRGIDGVNLIVQIYL